MNRDWNVTIIMEDGTYRNTLNMKEPTKAQVLTRIANDHSIEQDKILSVTIVPVNKVNMQYFQTGEGQFE
ncbi:hypothetical protein F400_gp035 [Bacillus phage BCD7]|uniref:Uncharacterized protein n=1 Tax=Bacillus phage BCD7 TaxID=1136534 RepID=J9PUC7_9CAUD|nr:hypothetical protein F400_gp035 [Bacillus phage BCD7]AEZ50482.1 hypothetical protein BCD7_0035 [Bacillus phage BCD7]